MLLLLYRVEHLHNKILDSSDRAGRAFLFNFLAVFDGCGVLSFAKTWRRFAKILGLWLVGCLLVGCGQTLSTDETLTVVMYGVFESPADATGNVEPRSQSYSLTGVSLLNADGTATSVMTETDPKSLKIINRAQIIEEASLHAYVGTTFTGIRVTFAEALTGAGKYEPAMATTLTTTDLDLVETVAVESASTFRLKVKVQWKNTVTRDETVTPPTEEMTAPTFELGIGND